MGANNIPLVDFLTFLANKKLISQLNFTEEEKNLHSKSAIALSQFRPTVHASVW